MSKWDKILVVCIFLACIISLIFVNAFAYTHEASTVVIELDGKEYARYNLHEINEPTFLEIDSEYGYNKIEIFSGGARVVDANCEDRLDVKAGDITHANEYIICLPHRLLVRLEGGDGYLDAVSY